MRWRAISNPMPHGRTGPRTHGWRIMWRLRWPLLVGAGVVVILASMLAGGLPHSPRAGAVHAAQAAQAAHGLGGPTPAGSAPKNAPGNATLNAAEGCADGAPPPLSTAIRGIARAGTGEPAPREVALTFDDGPSPYSSPAILDILERTHTPATFFVIGQQVRKWPYLVQREWRDGFAIGVHTWDHPDMTRLPADRMRHELSDTTNALHRALGSDACIWLWRPPYGDYNQRVLHAAGAQGLSAITWNVDPRDWSRPGTNVIVQRVLSTAGPGAIILFHDGPALRQQTAAALPTIIATLRARGLKLVTVPQLLADAHFPGIHMTPPGPPPRMCGAGDNLFAGDAAGDAAGSPPSMAHATIHSNALLAPEMPACLPRSPAADVRPATR